MGYILHEVVVDIFIKGGTIEIWINERVDFSIFKRGFVDLEDGCFKYSFVDYMIFGTWTENIIKSNL